MFPLILHCNITPSPPLLFLRINGRSGSPLGIEWEMEEDKEASGTGRSFGMAESKAAGLLPQHVAAALQTSHTRRPGKREGHSVHWEKSVQAGV